MKSSAAIRRQADATKNPNHSLQWLSGRGNFDKGPNTRYTFTLSVVVTR